MIPQHSHKLCLKPSRFYLALTTFCPTGIARPAARLVHHFRPTPADPDYADDRAFLMSELFLNFD